MALLRFELKEEHIALIRNLVWDEKLIVLFLKELEFTESTVTPFGGDDIVEDMGLILFGNVIGEEFNPMSDEVSIYDELQVSQMKKLFEELPTALDVVLLNGNFEVGHYKTKWNVRNWVKYTPKEVTN